jgi:rubrerythrin
MDFTNPFVGMKPPTLTDAELAQAIRLDMAAELDAINLYQAHIAATTNPVAKQVITHIMEEEKEHLIEFQQLLLLLDPKQAEIAGNAAQEFAEAGGPTANLPTPAAPTVPDVALPGGGGLTVGSLKG